MRLKLFSFIFFSLVSSVALQADLVTVLPPNATIAGRSIAQYTGDWYNWAYNFPAADGDPIDDLTGSLASLYQSTPVFHVAGTYGLTVERSFQVQPNTHLLFPLINSFSINISDETAVPAEEIDFVNNNIATVDSLFFEVNGLSLGNTEFLQQYLQSQFFTYNASVPNVYGDPLGDWPNYIKGYWIAIEPLAPGDYTFRFGGGSSANDFAVDVTANITVVPEPSSSAMCLLLAGGSFAIRRFRSARSKQLGLS